MLIVLNEDKSGKPNATEPKVIFLKDGSCAHLILIIIHRVSNKMLIKENFDINIRIIYPSIACIVLSIVFIILQRVSFLYSIGMNVHSGINCWIWLTLTI